jgi:hypothetical protein
MKKTIIILLLAILGSGACFAQSTDGKNYFQKKHEISLGAVNVFGNNQTTVVQQVYPWYYPVINDSDLSVSFLCVL